MSPENGRSDSDEIPPLGAHTFADETDSRVPHVIRRIVPGPPESVSQPQSAPKHTRLMRVREIDARLRASFQLIRLRADPIVNILTAVPPNASKDTPNVGPFSPASSAFALASPRYRGKMTAHAAAPSSPQGTTDRGDRQGGGAVRRYGAAKNCGVAELHAGYCAEALCKADFMEIGKVGCTTRRRPDEPGVAQVSVLWVQFVAP